MMTEEGAAWCKEAAQDMIKGRKGHGSGPCTKRVLNVDQLETVIRLAYTKGMNDAAKDGEKKPDA